MAERARLVPSGFFAWRTPLLPYAEATGLSAGLRAPGALAEGGGGLTDAVAADRAEVRQRLRAMVGRPEVREAIFLASPDLDSALAQWIANPSAESGVEAALLRYATRMASRPTPFGAFAGCSVGSTGGPVSRLELAPRGAYRRATRLDLGYLTGLADTLAADPEVRAELEYRPNSSLYRTPGRVRYVESRRSGPDRSYHLVSLPTTDALTAALDRATNGATPGELADAVRRTGAGEAAADGYVDALITRQVVVPDLGVHLTGTDPLAPLVDELARHAPAKQVANTLNRVAGELAGMDRAGLGESPARYRALAGELAELPAPIELGRLFQLDLVKPAAVARLGDAVTSELARAVDVLHRLARPWSDPALVEFRDAFVRRYEGETVPLTDALDEESGVGFGGSDPAPLLRGIAFPTAEPDRMPWGARERLLLRRLLAGGDAPELVLSKADIDEMASPEPLPLPAALSVGAIIAAAPDELARGRFELVVQGIPGPSGAQLLGRFCLADPELDAAVRRHLRAEEATDPEAIYAEIVHLPEGRVGNVLARPVLREYEIVYLGRSGAPASQRLPVTDLLVSVHGERIELSSARLGRRVVPRLTTAHNFSWRSLPLYRFLCSLQRHGTAAGLGFSWGALDAAPFLPRVRHGRLVLALARWRVERDELRRLGAASGAAALRALSTWRAQRRVPRWVQLVDGDNRLLVDLANVVAVESFLGLVRGRQVAVLEEVYPGPERLCATGPEGSFTHEVIVPFVREQPAPSRTSASRTSASRSSAARAAPARRRFAPGDRWLYLKLYCGAATADEALRDAVAPTANRLVTADAGEGWFFLRYADPDPHLRIRITGDPGWLGRTAWPALSGALAPWVDDGRVWRVCLDTYQPEVERYGGSAAITIAERLFHADSVAVAAILARLSPGDAGRRERWRLALRGTHLLLSGLGLDLDARCRTARDRRDANRVEHRLRTGALRAPIGQRYREQQDEVAGLLAPTWAADHPLAPGFAALDGLHRAAVSARAELRELAVAGALTCPLEDIAVSLCHMHANRLLRASHRRQEAVLWDFLARSYERDAHQDRARGHAPAVPGDNDADTPPAR